MRIIAGTYKGRPLESVSGRSTRPTSDKVKGAIFNMLGPYFSAEKVLDLYAGTGALGLEALSRGALHITFIDQDAKAIQTIKKNIQALGVEKSCSVYRNDAQRALLFLVQQQVQFDLVFLDPPYQKQRIESDMAILWDHKLLSPFAVIVAEHDVGTTLQTNVAGLEIWKENTYGDTVVTIYRVKKEGEE
ncbi:16S rRNA (guanine(966)-N(2))-methyltransferase RsmD [Rubeoparvulum massiliense]|uniref:16S rRNA (guanine(966)-N(2))-methyltransferase RsmD n=1 Tax=Rubeoparvulum massiliense TaxID=1631346 RepID=UPI00065DF844